MRLDHAFTEHPHSIGETYWQHQRHAAGFAFSLFAAGAACLVHALAPALFERTGSRMIGELHDRMVVNRRRAHAKTARAA